MATQDLTTKAEVKEHLGIAASNTDHDDLLDDLVTAASDAIMRYAQREFVTTTAGSTARDFRYNGRGFLNLAPWDLRSVESVVIDVDGVSPDSTTLDADDYRLMPVHKPDGVYTHLQLRGFEISESSSHARYEPFRVVRVTSSTWGFASVPKPVERACIITVAWLKRSTGDMMGDEMGIDAPFTGDRLAIPGARQGKRLTPKQVLTRPERARLALQIADIYNEMELGVEAEKLADMILVDPSFKGTVFQKSWAYYNKATALHHQKRQLEAVDFYALSGSTAPKASWAPRVLYYAGSTYCSFSQDWKKGGEYFETLAKAHPETDRGIKAYYMVGYCAEHAGDLDKAKKQYESFLKDYPDSGWADLIRRIHLPRLEKKLAKINN